MPRHRQANLPQTIRLAQITVDIDQQIGHPDLEADRAFLAQLKAELAARG